MAGWNLALRFGLELVALAGLALAAWRWTPGPARLVAVVAAPLVAAVVWGTFNVVGDPSRSGQAPVEVPGVTRLLLEVAVLGAGAAGLALAWRPEAGLAMAGVTVAHYAAGWSRLRWLLAS